MRVFWYRSTHQEDFPGSKYKNRPWDNTLAGGRKSPWNRVEKIMGPVLVFLSVNSVSLGSVLQPGQKGKYCKLK